MLDHPTALYLFIFNLKAVSNKYSEDSRRWRFQGCEQDHRNFCGNTCLAPEVFHSQLYHTKADIYCLGIILWEMWYEQQAFSDVSNIPSHVALFAMVDEGLRPEHVKGCNEPPGRWK